MVYDTSEAVFYNKVMVLNRDLSIQVIRLFAERRNAERRARYEKKLEKYNSLIQQQQPQPQQQPQQQQQEQEKSTEQQQQKQQQQQLRPPYPPPEGITILDALAATGLRSVRYLKEIPGVSSVTINDLDPAATTTAFKNCESNQVDTSRVVIRNGDARMLMYEHASDPTKNFDVIDLDPYGTASPFLDSAVAAVADGGLLCVTCTDMPALSGSYPEVCFAKYGSVPLKARYCHEMSLRILLHALESAANRHKKHIVPWLSLSVDYYIRVFVRVFESPQEVKKSSLKRVMLYQSTQCPSFYAQAVGKVASHQKDGQPANFVAPLLTAPSQCEETGGNLRVGGPFWGDPIHDQEVVDTLLHRLTEGTENNDTSLLPYPVPTAPRIIGLLATMSEELKDVQMYYLLPDLAATLHATVPVMINFQAALVNAGYRVSGFHHEPHAIKTDAPPKVVWDIMRSYCEAHPPTGSSHKKCSNSAKAILSKEITTRANFEVTADMLEKRRKKVARFPPNPEENWGPKRFASSTICSFYSCRSPLPLKVLLHSLCMLL